MSAGGGRGARGGGRGGGGRGGGGGGGRGRGGNNSNAPPPLHAMGSGVFQTRTGLLECHWALVTSYDEAERILQPFVDLRGYTFGFDTESDQSAAGRPLATVQLATRTHSWVFRVDKCVDGRGVLSPSLRTILSQHSFVKIACDASKDATETFRGLNLVVPSIIDIQMLGFGLDIGRPGRPGLNQLGKIYVPEFEPKSSDMGWKTKWLAPAISDAAVRYAALDAWWTLHIYRWMVRTPFEATELVKELTGGAGASTSSGGGAGASISTDIGGAPIVSGATAARARQAGAAAEAAASPPPYSKIAPAAKPTAKGAPAAAPVAGAGAGAAAPGTGFNLPAASPADKREFEQLYYNHPDALKSKRFDRLVNGCIFTLNLWRELPMEARLERARMMITYLREKGILPP